MTEARKAITERHNPNLPDGHPQLEDWGYTLPDKYTDLDNPRPAYDWKSDSARRRYTA